MNDTEIVEHLLSNATHMVLAVTLADGTPWVVPVRIRGRADRVFEWDSSATASHSQAIHTHPHVALTIFSIDDDIGLYMKATAEALPDVQRDDGYVRYRATVTDVWLNERHTKRRFAL